MVAFGACGDGDESTSPPRTTESGIPNTLELPVGLRQALGEEADGATVNGCVEVIRSGERMSEGRPQKCTITVGGEKRTYEISSDGWIQIK